MAGPVVADTHAALWYLGGKKKLSTAALTAIDEALVASEPVYVSAISLVEVIYSGRAVKRPPTSSGVGREQNWLEDPW